MKTHRPLLKFALLTVLLLSLGTPCAAQEEETGVIDEIVAKVNSEIITLTDLRKSLGQLKSALEQDYSNPQELEKAFQERKRSLLKDMIQSKVMLQKAEELGVASDVDVDVSAYLEEMRKEAGIPSLDVLDEFFRQRGSSLSEYRQRVKEQMISRSLIDQFVYSKITLLTPEVEAYYQEHAERFTEAASVELAEILFLTEGKNQEEVRKRAENAVSRLNGGEAFEDVAKEVSEGPTASRGGEIGKFNKGSINVELEKVVFAVPVGTVSGIIESEYGFQIVKVLSRQESKLKPLSDVRPMIAEALYQKKAAPELKEFLQSLIDESYIFISPKYAETYDVEDLG